MKKQFGLIIVAILVAFTNTFAATYYVSPTGNDAGPGTLEQPWATIQRSVVTLNAGDTVYVMDGLYREMVRINRSGQPGLPRTTREVVTVY